MKDEPCAYAPHCHRPRGHAGVCGGASSSDAIKAPQTRLDDLHDERAAIKAAGVPETPSLDEMIAEARRELMARRFRASTSRATWETTLGEAVAIVVTRDEALTLCVLEVGQRAEVEGVTYERIA